MNRVHNLKRILVIVSTFALICSTGGSVGGAKADSPVWAVSGFWSEACPCTFLCPCWNAKAPTSGHCETIQVFKIAKGQYGDVPLDGLVVVFAWVTPEGQLMRESAGRSRLFATYVDAATTQLQRDAVAKIWRTIKPFSAINAMRGELKAVKMTAEVEHEYSKVSIPGILTYEVRSKDNAVILKDPTRSDFQEGVAVAFRYSDFGVNWDYPGKHAMLGEFDAQSASGAFKEGERQ